MDAAEVAVYCSVMDDVDWKPITGFIDYEVSRLGVRSWKPYRNGAQRPSKPRMMKTRLNGGGYPSLSLFHEGKVIPVLVHRLVAEAFVAGRSDACSCVDHKNGDKTDFRPENLQWISNAENMAKAHRTGENDTKGSSNGRAKITEADVVAIRHAVSSGTATKLELAARYGVTDTSISFIVLRRTWRHVP